jgi:hypothetical protein
VVLVITEHNLPEPCTDFGHAIMELLRRESTGEQAIKDLTAAALEKEKKKK